MKTVLEIINLSATYLDDQGIQSSKREAEEILSIALNLPRLDLYLNYDKPLKETELLTIRTLLKKRAKREPLQYIKGSVEFMDANIQVNGSVLIPRQETEILASIIIERLQRENLKEKILYDIATGSGCLAIAIKKHLPDLTVYASDISPEALSIAQLNAKNNNVDVVFLEADMLEPPRLASIDFVVSNPPYIKTMDLASLEPEVREFEPVLALDGGDTGLHYYERLAQVLQKYKKNNFKIWLEYGLGQAEDIQKIFKSCGWPEGMIIEDWSGKERFFFLEIE